MVGTIWRMFWRKWILGVNRGKEDGGEKSEEGEGREKEKLVPWRVF